MIDRKNKNRGYQQLRVWQDAITLYVETCREYIQHLYVALSSLGESVSGYHAYRKADQLSAESFEVLDQRAFKLENGLLRLIESLERKRDSGTWTETLIINESNAIYTSESSKYLIPDE